jgi:CheY-like chemotaxis protein
VELICVASAAEALDRIGRGERFDVALIDTAMPGMDGWTLLSRLRDMEETTRMPIALMAGVLDPVDPSKLAKAPIQGFLKKPIELRELGDRVKALLATPVVVGPSPFSTVPATSTKDLLKHAEESLPELRPEHVEIPTGLVDVDLGLPEPEDDLIVLTAEDLWPEEPVSVMPEPVPSTPVLHDVHLELEELDLDSLQDLAMEPLAETGRSSGLLPEPLSVPRPEHVHPGGEDHLLTLSGLEELETIPTDFIETPHPTPHTQVPEHGSAPGDSLTHLSEAATLLGMGGAAGVAALGAHAFVHGAHEPAPAMHDPVPVVHDPAPAMHDPVPVVHEPALAIHELAPVVHEPAPAFHEPAPEVQEPVPAIHEPAPMVHAPAPAIHELAPLAHEPAPGTQGPFPHPGAGGSVSTSAAGGQAPAAPGHATPVPTEPMLVTSEQARAVVQALLADPVLVDVLVKALVARLGDQVLREIAWEVMPDLAGRLQR